MKEKDYCISIDWLTLFCKFDTNNKDNIINLDTHLFRGQKQEYGTRQFETVVEIFHTINNDKYCTLCFNPHNSVIIPEDTGTAQLANRYLYDYGSIASFLYLLQQLKITPQSITRIDIAIDTLYYDNGMTGDTLVKGYMTGKYIRMGKSNFKAIGSDNTTKVYDTLTFGSGSSDKTLKIYNKSKEMREQTTKEYIIAKWIQFGVFDPKHDTYRMEVSIKSQGNSLKKVDDSQKIKIDITDIYDQNKIREILIIFIKQLARFRIAESATRKRRCKPLILFQFEKEKATIVPHKFAGIGQTTRSHRNAINRLKAIIECNCAKEETRRAAMAAAAALENESLSLKLKKLKDLKSDE